MWSTKSNSITESKLSLYTIEECTHFSSFDSTKIEEDSNSQQCKTTKCCNMDSFIFQSILTSNDEGKQKNNSRRNSCSPAFHYKRKISIIDQKESIPLRANGSAKTLSNFTPKPHASNTFSASAINHLSSVLSYYDSTREYLLKEMKSTESSTPQNGYNFIKRDRNKCDSFKSNSCSSNKFNYPPSRNAYFNNQPMIKSSPMLYMTMAQFNYAKYCQDYYSKMRQYIANKENKLSQFAPGDMIDANSESNRQIEIEDSKHQTDSLSFSMHGKNGWVCGQCNNFNFESKNGLMIYIYFNSLAYV